MTGWVKKLFSKSTNKEGVNTMSDTFKVRTNSRKEEVFNMLGLHPNSTTKELTALMPHMDIDNVSHAISSMAAKGLVFVTGRKAEEGPSGRITTHRAYSVKYTKPSKDTAPKAAPQGDLFSQLVRTLEEEVKALEQWKQAALLRYPDLDVDPILLEARALLATEAQECGSEMLADEIINGKRDSSFSVKAMVKVLGARS
jgi:hypothetical protein